MDRPRHEYVPASSDIHDPRYDEDMPSAIGAPRPRRLASHERPMEPNYDIVGAAAALTMQATVELIDMKFDEL